MFRYVFGWHQSGTDRIYVIIYALNQLDSALSNTNIVVTDSLNAKIVIDVQEVQQIWVLLTVISKNNLGSFSGSQITNLDTEFRNTIFDNRPKTSKDCFCKFPNSDYSRQCR